MPTTSAYSLSHHIIILNFPTAPFSILEKGERPFSVQPVWHSPKLPVATGDWSRMK